MSRVFPRLFQQFKVESRFSTLICTQARPKAVKVEGTTRVPVMRFVQSSPKEYNGLQTAAYHFKQQRHIPYFMEYLMWVIFGSEALHLIWLKMDMKEYKEKTKLKTRLLEEIIQRIENGEVIDDNLRKEIKVVLMNSKKDHEEDIDDEYLNNCKKRKKKGGWG
ncbi:hypothetical protein BD770DRAFT_190035 [Pilaira anomala]|nr:hypothetical protein BD770DRAFT_190035 [Pilaira anomala]